MDDTADDTAVTVESGTEVADAGECFAADADPLGSNSVPALRPEGTRRGKSGSESGGAGVDVPGLWGGGGCGGATPDCG